MLADVVSMLKVGAIGFGGGSALIPVFEDELVRRRALLAPRTFEQHTVVASITPGALPVKLAGLAGLERSGAARAAVLAVAVAAPGTVLTMALVGLISAGGGSVVRYVELASVGITVFIIALLVHYVSRVVNESAAGRAAAITIAAVTLGLTGAGPSIQMLGELLGRSWMVPGVPRLSAVHVIGLAVVLLLVRAGVRRERGAGLAVVESSIGRTSVVRAAVLLLGIGLAACVVVVLVLGSDALGLVGLVAVSTATSFGGGEAYVAVADGFFVAGGHVPSGVFYNQLVPVANALPGPILVKLAAAIGYAAAYAEHGALGGWVLGGSAALVAITTCTAIAVVVMGVYARASQSPLVRDIGSVLLPVIGGLLVSTSVSMLRASADVGARAGVRGLVVLWASLLGIGLVTLARHRHAPDWALLVMCGATSLIALALATT